MRAEVVSQVPARVHLAGNPSDGYGGAVLSATIPELRAEVRIHHADRFSVVGPDRSWSSMAALATSAHRYGHDGGDRLVTAALVALDRALPAGDRRPGRVEWSTSIPRSVGLGGSSALVLATMRAAMQWWELDEPDGGALARLALDAEVEELGIPAGLADRAAQVHGGVVMTDCRDEEPAIRRVVLAEPVELTLAWSDQAAAPSGDYHRSLRDRVASGDETVPDMMKQLADLADRAAQALESGDRDGFAHALDHSLVLRRAMGPVPRPALEGVDELRAVGSAVNFAGSGGALVILGDSSHLGESWRRLRLVLA